MFNNIMEENIKAQILGQEIIIRKTSIINLQPLLTLQALMQFGFPRGLSKFKPELNVLHSCLYYLIAVQKNLQEAHSLEFREKCLESISEYYIKHSMNFQLYEYGHLCAKILSVPIDKSMHIIYFLVYARLASKPFINNMISQGEKKRTHLAKKTILKSQKQFSIHSKSVESRHFTVFFDSNQIETDNLKKQLSKILRPQGQEQKKLTKKIENKRFFNLKKIYPESDDFRDEYEASKTMEINSASTSRVVTIPLKVHQKQHSSVISRLKLKSGNICSDDALKKIQVRRQKFNEWLDSSDKIQHLISNCDLKDNKRVEWGTLKNIPDKDLKALQAKNYRNQKHPYEYFQGIAGYIRSKNQELDSIRFQCIHHNQKNLFNTTKQSFNSRSMNIKGFVLNKHLMKTQSAKIQSTEPVYSKIQTNRQLKENIVKQDYVYMQSQKQKDLNKSSKTTSFSKISENGLQDHAGSIITRRNEKVTIEQDNQILFNKKIKNKFKLQKYKQEYRHFLKTQTFDKFKESS